MTGSEHYRVAERLVEQGLNGDYGSHEDRMRTLAAAQVYATLALAAATGIAGRGNVDTNGEPRPAAGV